VEAVVDIDCDLRGGVNLNELKASAHGVFARDYPKLRVQMIQEHQIEQQGDHEPTFSARRGIQALQFLTEDEKQVVQVRAQGFSFNRLAPYSTLDNYLPEIERTWQLYREVVAPIQVRILRLRYINRILLPLIDGRVTFTDYLEVGPQLREPEGLSFRGFLNQYGAIEDSTGNEVNIVLATQAAEGRFLPIILDITAANPGALEPNDWPTILTTIQSLRDLKNQVFRSTLTERCLNLFQ
jgi:uncharacterized protein (TIGR04255 family)